MPDQYGYWDTVSKIRTFDFDEIVTFTTVLNASYIFSIIPMPFALTVSSLGFFNKFLYVSLFMFLWHKRVFTNFSIFFYLLYPSLVVYSSLSLRDFMITSFMIVSFVYFIERKYLLAFSFSSILIFIKFQNLILISIVFAMYFYFFCLPLRRQIALLVVLPIIYFILYSNFIGDINYYRAVMYFEDGGVRGVDAISGPFNFVFELIAGSVYFLLKPLPGEASNLFQLIQSLEGIFLFVVILYLLFSALILEKRTRVFLFWMAYIIITLGVYSLVVFNFGTAARYKFPFVLVFVVFICFDLKKMEVK
ncbi:hypothetical protein VII00023_01210 [Vibrio ichthyoenteri ATCC 700023]|uniref:O-antigen polymerase n=2 Tax=Vibrio ichthyoenteri TaxID=142461 RepID=F9S4N6_9VIBR|nr:hypothetical protein VII00023_01210 [Vibrio ichthyoenteri ATCC 700023]